MSNPDDEDADEAIEEAAFDSGTVAALNAFGDTSRPPADRLDALRRISLAAFDAGRFQPHQATFMQMLRTAATDPDAALCATAIDILARYHDQFAQGLLLQGLQNPSAAAVPPEIALRLLSIDGHSSAGPIAQSILTGSGNPQVRAQAAYLLSSDPGAVALLTARMTDKAEHSAVRQASAISLHTLNGMAFSLAARNIVDDASDYPEIRATSRTGLALLPDNNVGGGDTV
jgi:hypothetical protein